MRSVLVNGRWPVVLPEHRAEFHEERPWWEAARLADMAAWLGSFHEAKVLDVGSEEGDLTALYATWGCEIAFIDPSGPWVDQTCRILDANTGLGSFIGFAGLADSVTDETLKPRSEKVGFHTVDEDVPRMRLDDFCDHFQFYPDAVVIDVEGAEARVLYGAERLLDRGAVWWVSLHGEVDSHAPLPSPVHDFMRERGYRDQWLGHQHEWFFRFWKPEQHDFWHWDD